MHGKSKEREIKIPIIPTFTLNNKEYNYFYHEYHKTWQNERKVEIALGLKFLEYYPNLLEVGNVLSHYIETKHDIVDLYEKSTISSSRYFNEDIMLFNPKKQYDAILSISTLEHTKDILASVKKVINLAPIHLITFPIPNIRRGKPGTFGPTEVVLDQDFTMFFMKKEKYILIQSTPEEINYEKYKHTLIIITNSEHFF